MSDRRELDVTPEPPDEVAKAIAAALREDAAADESPWWRAGVEESLREERELA